MRLLSILTELTAGEPVPVEELAARLGVSRRTVQADVSYLRKVSGSHGFALQTRRGRGLQAVVTDPSEYARFCAFLNQEAPVSRSMRAEAILECVVLAGGYVSAGQIADELALSRTVVMGELPTVGTHAEAHGLTLVRMRHHGLRVTGLSYARKAFLAHAFGRPEGIVHGRLLDSQGPLDHVADALDAALSAEGLSPNYAELRRMMAFARATLHLSSQGDDGGRAEGEDAAAKTAEATIADGTAMAGEAAPTADGRAVRVARATLRSLAAGTPYQPSEEDVRDLARLVGALAAPTSVTLDRDTLEADLLSFLRACDERQGTSYLDDHALVEMLLAHVTYLVDRLGRSVSFENPLTREVTITNPSNTNMAFLLCQMLSERYGVAASADEVAFVAMHFAAHDERVRQDRLRDIARIAVVCSTGGGAAYLVKMQLEALFPSAEVRAVSHTEQSELATYGPDLVFSMVPLSSEVTAPTIYIHELLDETDLVTIRETVQYGELSAGTVGGMGDAMASLTSPELFSREPAPKTYEQLIRQMAHDLEVRGLARAGYAEQVLARERFSSTIYLNGVCIPHPLETCAERDAVSIRVLSEPLEEGGRTARVVFMICLRHDHVDLYLPISRRLYDVMRRPRLVARLCEATTYEELMGIMREGER